VVAVKGQAEGGTFMVEDVCVAGLPPQEKGPEGGSEGGMEVEEEEGEGTEEPRYVLLASGECFLGGGREEGGEGGMVYVGVCVSVGDFMTFNCFLIHIILFGLFLASLSQVSS